MFSDATPGISPGTSLDNYIWSCAPEFLSQPITPATRAGFYRLLAAIPGIRTAGVSRTPDGRTVVTIGYKVSDPLKEKLGRPGGMSFSFVEETGMYLGSQAGAGVESQLLAAEWTDVPGDRVGTHTNG
jgi:hypothetical protein